MCSLLQAYSRCIAELGPSSAVRRLYELTTADPRKLKRTRRIQLFRQMHSSA